MFSQEVYKMKNIAAPIAVTNVSPIFFATLQAVSEVNIIRRRAAHAVPPATIILCLTYAIRQ